MAGHRSVLQLRKGNGLKYTRPCFPPQYDVHMPLTGVTSLEDMMKYSPVSGSSGREPWVIYSEGRQG